MRPFSLKTIGLGLSAAVLGVLVSMLPTTLALEQNAGLDWLFRMRGAAEPPSEVAVVSIDRASAEALNLPLDSDRWPRHLHAQLIRRLVAAGASLIVFDLSFDSPREGEQDLILADAVREAGNVVLLERLRTDSVALASGQPSLIVENRLPPLPPLQHAALGTAPFPLPVVPVKVSQFWVFSPAHADIPTLPTLVFYAYARGAQDALLTLMHEVDPEAGSNASRPFRAEAAVRGLNETVMALRGRFMDEPRLAGELRARLDAAHDAAEAVPVASQDRQLLSALIGVYGGETSRYLDYYGPARSILTVPYHEILGAGWNPSGSALGGRVVFVGFSEPSAIEQQDSFYTPFSEQTGVNLSGVEIGATAFANLLHGRSVRPLSMPAQLLLLLTWGIAVAGLFMWLPGSAALAIGMLAVAAYVSVASELFRASGLWLPLVVPLLVQIPLAVLAGISCRYIEARAQGERVTRTLRYYLPAWVTDDASRRTGGVGAKPRLLHGTCLVTDAEQYTALSERLSPQDLHQLLNEYYAVLFREVERYGGFVTDVVGDSMVAVWTSPTQDPAAHEAACRASLAILRGVDSFNASGRRLELPTRIGLHAGRVLLADVGAESHFEYRAVGDIVNTASRIQGLNKHLGTRALVSSEALADAPGCVTRPLGSFLLAGKGKPLVLHELLSAEDSVAADTRGLCGAFAPALAAFLARDWVGAEAAFRVVLERYPADGPSCFYLARCREFLASDPGTTWDGTIAVAEK